MSCSVQISEPDEFLSLFCSHVAEDLNLLAVLHDHEPDHTLIQHLKELDFPFCLTIIPEQSPGSEALLLMEESLAHLGKHSDTQTLDELAADYASIYLNHNISASPEESVWLDEDGLMCQQSMFEVRGWYQRYGLEIKNWRQRPDDHLVYELQFIAWLLDKNNDMQTLEQISVFMDEHLLRWLGKFSERVMSRCDTQYFASIAALTGAYCEELRNILSLLTGQSRPSAEEIEQRMQAEQNHPEEAPMQYMPGMGPVI